MTRDQYLKTKSALTHIDDALREGKLTPEQRAAFKALSVELSNSASGGVTMVHFAI